MTGIIFDFNGTMFQDSPLHDCQKMTFYIICTATPMMKS